MNSIATFMLVRAMDEERRRQVHPRRAPESDPTSETSHPSRSRSWTVVLGFPRLQPSNG
jgi:hypothetical protein